MNPKGTFENGERIKEYTTKNILPLSGRLIPEFDRRRNIKDMFFRRPSSTPGSETPKPPAGEETGSGTATETQSAVSSSTEEASKAEGQEKPKSRSIPETAPSVKPSASKRTLKSETSLPLPKRSKTNASLGKNTPAKGQQNLKGFFKPKQATGTESNESERSNVTAVADEPETPSGSQASNTNLGDLSSSQVSQTEKSPRKGKDLPAVTSTAKEGSDTVIDPIVSKESWSKLFTKKPPPRCEGHDEPCMTLVTKKPGINQGRSFWMCSRPLGPSGNKEKGTEWRCSTFIWCSDWNAPG